MLRQIIKGNGLYQINNVVEINNLILVTTGQSIGSYDVEQLTGNLCLKLRKGENRILSTIYSFDGRREEMEQALTVYRHMLEIYMDALDIHTEIILI